MIPGQGTSMCCREARQEKEKKEHEKEEEEKENKEGVLVMAQRK